MTDCTARLQHHAVSSSDIHMSVGSCQMVPASSCCRLTLQPALSGYHAWRRLTWCAAAGSTGGDASKSAPSGAVECTVKLALLRKKFTLCCSRCDRSWRLLLHAALLPRRALQELLLPEVAAAEALLLCRLEAGKSWAAGLVHALACASSRACCLACTAMASQQAKCLHAAPAAKTKTVAAQSSRALQ